MSAHPSQPGATVASAPCPPPWQRPLDGASAWRRDDIGASHWRVDVPDRCLRELDALVDLLRAHPIPTEMLDPTDYPLDAARALMHEVRTTLDEGVGFAVVDRLPVERWGEQASKQVYWLLSSLIERPVAQSFDAKMLYDVRDTGKTIDTRVRGDLTRQELSWHTDYGFNHPPPYIGLLVLAVAPTGGVSSVASMHTAHDVLRQRHPELLERLYRPFHWNRQGEHPEGDPITHAYPIFSERDGEVRGRFIKWLLYRGYELVGEPFDALGRQALETMFAVMSEPEHHVSFVLEPGQLEYLRNDRVAHCRTEYEDDPRPDAPKRHLVRIFLRDAGRRSYMG
ncbi:MAG: TauD/TfdA family dioxygenase [Ectothiorhodospiraceae bacterium]|nr:TauD/TfdA family dioxygenase [Chromatiales bacterium]MCP5154203.1 TauD/TfdA family dioxygenase [Ectothiorhodospiraceae bacterium]